MNDETNPYASTASDGTAAGSAHPARARRFRWRLIPAILIGSVGGGSFLFGLFAVAIMMYVLVVQRDASFIAQMLAGCTLYLGFGCLWMASGWFTWRARYGLALLAALAGMALPLILVAIFGF